MLCSYNIIMYLFQNVPTSCSESTVTCGAFAGKRRERRSSSCSTRLTVSLSGRTRVKSSFRGCREESRLGQPPAVRDEDQASKEHRHQPRFATPAPQGMAWSCSRSACRGRASAEHPDALSAEAVLATSAWAAASVAGFVSRNGARTGVPHVNEDVPSGPAGGEGPT